MEGLHITKNSCLQCPLKSSVRAKYTFNVVTTHRVGSAEYEVNLIGTDFTPALVCLIGFDITNGICDSVFVVSSRLSICIFDHVGPILKTLT